MNLFLMDAMMVGLLIMAIAFCWRLNGRLQNIRDMGKEIRPFLSGLGSYMTQISQYIEKLRETSEATHKGLGQQLPQAIQLKDDFDFMLDHGEQLAQRLEKILERAHVTERQLNEIVQRTQRHKPENFAQAMREEERTPPVAAHMQPLPPQAPQQHAYLAKVPAPQQAPQMTREAPVYQNPKMDERNITSLLRGLR